MRPARLAALIVLLVFLVVACTPGGDTADSTGTAGTGSRDATATTSARATSTPTGSRTGTATPATSATEVTDEEFVAYAVQVLTGVPIIELRIDSRGAYIEYEQVSDVLEEQLIAQWMDLAIAVLAQMDEPRDITIVPVTEGREVARVIIPGSLLAEVLNGERSVQQAIAEIQVLEP